MTNVVKMYVLSTSDRLGVTMHPAQPERSAAMKEGVFVSAALFL